jgi:hypothetical protein
MMMTDDIPEGIVELSKAYLESHDSDDTTDDESEIEENLEYWQEQVEEFDEGTPMYEMAVEERDNYQENHNKISEQDERRSELRDELLTRASSEFAPQEGWMNETVISALTHAIIGEQRDRILIGDHCLPGDAAELSKREMVTVAKNVHAVAEDIVASNGSLDEVWEMMSTDKRYPITRILAEEKELVSSGDISAQLDDDGTDNPGANLRYVLNSAEYYPYYREDGDWRLSLLGEFAWQTRGPDDVEDEDDESNHDSEETDQQSSLDELDNGGDSDE